MSQPLLRRSFSFALFALVAWLALLNHPLDPDAFMHLRIGQWVLGHGFPTEDPFAQGHHHWIAYSWLFGIGAYEAFARGGWLGLLLAKAALCLVLAGQLLRLVDAREERLARSVPLVVLGVLGLVGGFAPRPWLVTIALFLLELSIVLEARETGNARRLAWLVPVFVVWANVHVQFVHGLFVLGLAFLEAAHETFVRREPPALGWKPLLGATVACTLATLVSPYHLETWRVVLEYALYKGAFEVVTELQAPTFRTFRDWVVLALVCGAALALGWRRERRLLPYALVAAGAAFFFRARRDAWFLDAASLVAILGPPRVAAERRTSRGALVVAGALALGALALVRADSIREGNLLRAEVTFYPAFAVRAIEERKLEGPLFNDFNWGNYLMWACPRLPVQIDGRTNLHGDERIARSLATWAGQPGWREDPELARAGCVVAPRSYPLATLLREDPRFRLVHEDHVAAVFSRVR